MSVKLTVLWKGKGSVSASAEFSVGNIHGGALQGVLQEAGRATAVTIERADLERLLAERAGGTRSALNAVRDGYAEIGLMREQGVSWAEIAEILACNGAVGRDGGPFTAATIRSAFFMVGVEGRQGQAEVEAESAFELGLTDEAGVAEGGDADADAVGETADVVVVEEAGFEEVALEELEPVLAVPGLSSGSFEVKTPPAHRPRDDDMWLLMPMEPRVVAKPFAVAAADEPLDQPFTPVLEPVVGSVSDEPVPNTEISAVVAPLVQATGRMNHETAMKVDWWTRGTGD